jgi:DNA-binding XRE family transcriptional regulator
MKTKRKVINDAVKILEQRYFKGKPEMQKLLEEERVNAEIARTLYNLRTKSKLTQRQLAKMVGTTPSVICRMEDGDYEGHSLSMLRRVAAALDRRVEVRFLPCRPGIHQTV